MGQVRVQGKGIIIASLYFDGKDRNVVPAGFKEVVNFCEKRGRQLIAGVDTNAHSVLYGPDQNARGDIVEDYLFSKGITVEIT